MSSMHDAVMNIKTWREREGLSQSACAKRIGVDQGLLSKWERSIVVPGGAWMARIIEVTDGEVQPKDLLQLPDVKERAQQESALRRAVSDVKDGTLSMRAAGESHRVSEYRLKAALLDSGWVPPSRRDTKRKGGAQ